jgi:hypothetical protein
MTLDVRNGTNVTVVDMDIQTRSYHPANNWKSDPANTDKQNWRLAHLSLASVVASDPTGGEIRIAYSESISAGGIGWMLRHQARRCNQFISKP